MASDEVPPFITAQLKYLLSNFPHGIKIERMWSGSNHSPRLIDRFVLLIPYCLDVIRWEIIFDAECPMSAPDVVFGPRDEGFHPFHMDLVEGQPDLRLKKNILRDWSYKDPSRLLALITLLRDQYILYQRKRVSEVDDDRLKFEVSTIVAREGLEMQLYSVADKPKEVKLAILLMAMKLNDILRVFSWKNPQKIYLQVIYPVAKYGSGPSTPDVKFISTSELKAIFSIDDVKPPNWCDGMCMAEFIPQVEEIIEGKILEAVSLIETRRHFIVALASRLGWSVEADSVFCRKATFLVSSGAFIFLTFMINANLLRDPFVTSLLVNYGGKVHMRISTHFPRQQPALMLQSSQHFNSSGAPIKSQLLTEYPWSPRWQLMEMVERIYDFLVEEAPNFKRHCNDVQLQP